MESSEPTLNHSAGRPITGHPNARSFVVGLADAGIDLRPGARKYCQSKTITVHNDVCTPCPSRGWIRDLGCADTGRLPDREPVFD